ncbi:hypothetical protein Lqui_1519 [Legionella quinlivanii]|uniref:DUF6969 domain-containing protein n=1 Tax=Legionella quinlivanii TaxID=45073 RepID=A0A0W0Y0L0_9GAMM|nr:hypothetical protein [Legionella quinlivanii]KTD50194.1 hypothetical protein Lqui_1519 [Legionella quinlivanii]MCW8450061.1 hypothetical protein [Legionella quinlivanii]SEF47971.1 hypothetical protein SAMN02746093_00318 [Legionella quinlivanii DSM 21216]STY11792.1 Uncharacterised protein [Legionella quinlivanii]
MSEFSLPYLSKTKQSRLLAYASQILEAQQQMTTAKGKNIIHYTLQKKRRHESMSHYPKGDRIDRQTGAQYFYHCHREDYESMEHGHFHCFLRYKGIPAKITPTPLSDWDKNMDNPMTHIVAISMNCLGQPIRLFTVNRWVSSEIWYDAKHVSSFIKKYEMTLEDDPYWMILDQWVEGMLHLFEPQIVWLHQERDKQIARIKAEDAESNPYEDHRYEELSYIDIDLTSQVQWVLNAINQSETPAEV